MRAIGWTLAGILFAHMGNAAAQDFSYPPEWHRQDAVWIGWEDLPESADDPTYGFALQRRSVRAAIVRELTSGSRVVIQVASDQAAADAKQTLEAIGVDLGQVDFQKVAVGDLFVRDLGPRFLKDDDKLVIADIPWRCYGYSREMAGEYLDYCLQRAGNDNQLAEAVGLEMRASSVASEGGALEATSTLLMGYLDTAMQRNPGLTKAQIEAAYLEIYGKEKMIWLSEAPLSDRPGHKIDRYFGWGANGHVDEYARFVNETTVVIAQVDEDDLTNPLAIADDQTLRQNKSELAQASTMAGEPLTIIDMPSPDRSHFSYEMPLGRGPAPARWADLVDGIEVGDLVMMTPAVSYMNFIIANDKIIVPAYWSEGMPEEVLEDDNRAKEILQGLFPGREVVQLNPLPINWQGGGMHCSTQQQPSVEITASY